MKLDAFIDRAMFYDELDEVVASIQALDLPKREIVIGNGDRYKLTKSAVDLALRRIGISGTIKDFTRSNGIVDIEFVNEAINRKIVKWGIRPSKFLTDGTYIYSVMSAKYERVKHGTILNELSKRIDIDEYFDDKRSYVTDKNMHLYLKGINNFIISNDDEYMFGVLVRNSETGWGALGLGQFIERLICSNGLTSKLASLSVSMKHVGEIESKFKSKIDGILTPEPVIKVLNESLNKPKLVSDLDNLPRFLSKMRIRKEHHDGIKSAWLVEKDLGLGPYGISNAITRYNDHVYSTRPDYDPDMYYEMATIALELLSF